MSNPTHFKLELIERFDSKGDSYYIGSVNFNFPMLVDLSAVDFLVFHPEEPEPGEEDADNRTATLVIRKGNRSQDHNPNLKAKHTAIKRTKHKK